MIAAIEHREAKPEYVGMWQRLVRVRDVLRPDGRYGTAEVTGEADTFFSVPARMSINGRKVRGFLSVDHFGKDVQAPSITDYYPHGVPADWQINNGWDLSVWLFTPYTYA